MDQISFSQFIESTENKLARSYFPLGAFNPGLDNYGVLNETNQERLEEKWKGRITNSNIYIDQVESNWIIQFESTKQATALHMLYSVILKEAKKIQIEAAKKLGRDPELLKDLTISKGFELWEDTLPSLKGHTFNPTDYFKKHGQLPKDFDFGEMTTGAMELLDKLERPINTKKLNELNSLFGENPEKAKEEYLSKDNPQRGVCGYNLYYDPENEKIVDSKKTGKSKTIFEDFQSMTRSQANDILSDYRRDINTGLMGSVGKIGDVDLKTKFFRKEGGRLNDLYRYQRDFEGNIYVLENGYQYEHVLDLDTIKALINQGHPSFKNIEISSSTLRNKKYEFPIDKRTGEQFWPSFFPNGFSAPSANVRKARMSYQDTLGIRQSGKFVEVDIPALNGTKKYKPYTENPDGTKVYKTKCYAEALENTLGTDFTGKVSKEDIKTFVEQGELENLSNGLNSVEEYLTKVETNKIGSTFVQHVNVNVPTTLLPGPNGKLVPRRLSVGKGSGFSALAGTTSGNVTEKFPLNPSNEDAVLLSNIHNNLIMRNADSKSIAQEVFDGWTKNKDGDWKDMKASRLGRDKLIQYETKLISDMEEYMLDYTPGHPAVLDFLEKFLKELREEENTSERSSRLKDYILNGLKNDANARKRAFDLIKDPKKGLKEFFAKAKRFVKQRGLSFLTSEVQDGLDERDGRHGVGSRVRDKGAETPPDKDNPELSPSKIKETWEKTAIQFFNLINDKKNERLFEGDKDKWWTWVVDKYKENLGIESDSESIEKIRNDKQIKQMFLSIFDKLDSSAMQRLKDILEPKPKPQSKPQPVSTQPPQQPQQQLSYQIPEKKGETPEYAELRKNLNHFFATSDKIKSPADIPGDNVKGMYSTPAIQKAVELGFPGFDDRPAEEIVRELPQNKDESVNSVILASKDDLVSILSESNGEKVFETIKEQLALRKDVCEIIASAELEKQRKNL